MPTYGASTRGTQVLYVNAAAGDRASLQMFAQGRVGMRHLTFVTDFDDGTTIRTSSAGNRVSIDPKAFDVTLRDQRDPRILYAAHLKNVSEHEPAGAKRVLPPSGEELQFIERRNADALRQTLPRNGWELDPDGEHYRITWRRAFRQAATAIWPVKNVLRWRTKRRPSPPQAEAASR
jgi:hypothetical protein